MTTENSEKTQDEQEYGRLLKSSLITGSAQVIVMALSFMRVKVAAVFIGAQGVGIIGLYNQTLSLITTTAGLGLNSSAVREVAAASGAGDRDKVAQTVKSLRILVFATGATGAIICLISAPLLSQWTFGNQTHTESFRVLGITVFLAELSNGQAALLRGLGKVRELAIQNVITATIATIAISTFYITLGKNGIIPGMLALSATTLAGTWWFVRKERIKTPPIKWETVAKEARALITMGIAFVWSALIAALTVYGIGIVIRQKEGLAGNGYYQSAWGVSGMFIGIILSAMGQDFYPRLTALITDKQRACKLISKQIEVGLALSLPAVVAMAGFTELLIRTLYTKDFMEAKVAITWFTAGAYLKIISWPLGYVLMAKGDALRFAATETAFATTWFALSYLGANHFGLSGASAAFFAAYMLYCITMRIIIGQLIGFKFGLKNITIAACGLFAMGIAAAAPTWIGALLTFACAGYSLHWLNTTQEESSIKKLWTQIKQHISGKAEKSNTSKTQS